jgi:hypothetical protein
MKKKRAVAFIIKFGIAIIVDPIPATAASLQPSFISGEEKSQWIKEKIIDKKLKPGEENFGNKP